MRVRPSKWHILNAMMVQLLSFVFICLSNVIFQETLLEMDVKTVNVSEYFKVQIGTKFPFSFKLIFFFITCQKNCYILACIWKQLSLWWKWIPQYTQRQFTSINPFVCRQVSTINVWNPLLRAVWKDTMSLFLLMDRQ